MRARIAATALYLVAALGISTLAAAPANAATAPASTVFSQVNAQRTKAGLKPLISDPALDAAARAWAQRLASTCTFTHSSSSWRSARIAKAGWRSSGENIAAGYTSASSVMSGWMGSSGHKANILNKSYTGLGVGYATGSCGYKSYWVQLFGTGKTAGGAGAGDVNGDQRPDVVAVNGAGQLLGYRGSGTGGWGGAFVAASGWGPDDDLVTLGDFDGDSIADLGRIRADGTFELLAGTGAGRYKTPRVIGSGWAVFTRLIGGVDFNGDGRTDVLARTSDGALRLYKGSGSGGWLSGVTTVGSGWGPFTAIFYAGDFSGDGRGDIMARRGDGTLWLYPTTGRGSWDSARQIGSGWNSMTAIFSPGDFDGAGKPDVLARSADGALRLYRGNGRGGWAGSAVIGSGWNGMVQLG